MATKKTKLNQKLTKATPKKVSDKTAKKKVSVKKKTVKTTSIKTAQPEKNIEQVKKRKKIEAPSVKIKEEKEPVVKIKKTQEKTVTKKKKDYKKILITSMLLLLLVVSITAYFHIKDEPVKEEKNYKKYKIGDKVELANNSIWYVIEASDNNKSYVTLLAEAPADINEDKKINASDVMQFDKENKANYNEEEESNIGHYLINIYRYKLTDISGIRKVRLLESAEFVAIREAMSWDYEWEKENWLAGKSIGYWWLNSTQNGKVYVVNNQGSYSLQSANKKYYIRPVIEISKSEVKLIEDKVEEKKGE